MNPPKLGKRSSCNRYGEYSDAILLIPKQPLTSTLTYAVSITANSNTYTGSFIANSEKFFHPTTSEASMHLPTDN